jgi:hypothetical protein
MIQANHSSKQLQLWPAEFVPRRLIFHEDFDGICSAAILMRFFGQELQLEPVNYSIKTRWLARDLSEVAVVDFLYHPTALWWFDHHVTSFINDDLKESYRPDARHRWDITCPSCPSLILTVLGESTNVDDLRSLFREWIVWSDIIDSAQYLSPHQAVLGENPCILLNQALSESRSLELRRYMVRKIANGARPDELMLDKEVQPLWTQFRQRQLAGLKAIEKRLQVIGPVGYCDLTDIAVPFVRYGLYLFAPDILFSVMAYKSARGSAPYMISLSANPWRTNGTSLVNLGDLARKYGGGGRETVGSIPVYNPREIAQLVEQLTQFLANAVTNPAEAINE